MKKVIIYESTYGSTAFYAEAIANTLDCSVLRMSDVDPTSLSEYDIIILGSCLLGGEIVDAAEFSSLIEAYPQINWVLFVVGLANPRLTSFDTVISETFSADIAQNIPRFHFRGVVRHKRLGLMHQLVNRAKQMKQPIDSLPLEADEIGLIQRFGTTIDSEDISLITPLIDWVMQIETQEKPR